MKLNFFIKKHSFLFHCKRSLYSTATSEKSATTTYLQTLNPYSVTLYNHLLKKATEHDELNNKFLEISIKQANMTED